MSMIYFTFYFNLGTHDYGNTNSGIYISINLYICRGTPYYDWIAPIVIFKSSESFALNEDIYFPFVNRTTSIHS